MSKKEQPFNNPFQKISLKKEEPKPPAAKSAPVNRPPPPQQSKKAVKQQPLDEESRLFLEAVGEIEKVRFAKTQVGPPQPPSAAQLRIPNEEAESLTRLAELVSGDGPFELSDSDEFIEGHVQGFDGNVMRKLRAGVFTVNADIDLHGMTRDVAKPALERFIQNARIAGHRCVLIVTGKGLNSADQVPVLRQGVQEWLTRGRSSKQVLGFCSAKPKDGGAGALYVLLRR